MTAAIHLDTEPRHGGLVCEVSSPDRPALTELGVQHGPFIRERVVGHGAALLSGYQWAGWDDLDAFVKHVVSAPLDYTERSSPRTELHPGVFTATDHPPTEEIFLHTEQSYNLNVPRYLFFFCKQGAPEGGASRLADCRAIHDALPREIVERFDKEGYLLVRNFLPGLGLSWQEAFATEDRDQVRRYCADNGIEVEWLAEDHVQTRQVRWAVATHPETGVKSWFNHMTFFNSSALKKDLAELLLEEYGPWGIPTNTFHADGSEIEQDVMDELHAAYRGHELDVHARNGDVLIVDNLSVAHGRAPFVPPRELFVSMADALSWARLRPVERTALPGGGSAVRGD
ncbi:TauD/TfdA family dioxygenase [Streptomyces sp. NPDC019937]|uniref:TauD/TfdA family dioxygenase n=1 Tax=Streptomyces sp. NPDC019937 TaxID=3154787 RepID=UPI0033D15220